MKTNKRGFIAPLVIVIIASLVAGSGTYLYLQKKDIKIENSNLISNETKTSSMSLEIEQSQSINKTEEKVVTPKKTLKTFVQSSGIYTASYPSDWTYSEDQLSTRFQTVNEGASQSFDVVLGVDSDNAIEIMSKQNTSEKITIGSNVFTKLARMTSPRGDMMYLLPIGSVGARSTYLAVLIEGSEEINKNELDSFLGSIKVDPSKSSIIINRQDNIISDAQIRAHVSNIRVNVEMYFIDNKTYVGICDSTNEKTKLAKIDRILDGVSKIVSLDKIYCNASNDAYVYSVHMLNGEIMCADSTGFANIINTEAKSLSCK